MSGATVCSVCGAGVESGVDDGIFARGWTCCAACKEKVREAPAPRIMDLQELKVWEGVDPKKPMWACLGYSFTSRKDAIEAARGIRRVRRGAKLRVTVAGLPPSPPDTMDNPWTETYIDYEEPADAPPATAGDLLPELTAGGRAFGEGCTFNSRDATHIIFGARGTERTPDKLRCLDEMRPRDAPRGSLGMRGLGPTPDDVLRGIDETRASTWHVAEQRAYAAEQKACDAEQRAEDFERQLRDAEQQAWLSGYNTRVTVTRLKRVCYIFLIGIAAASVVYHAPDVLAALQ